MKEGYILLMKLAWALLRLEKTEKCSNHNSRTLKGSERQG